MARDCLFIRDLSRQLRQPPVQLREEIESLRSSKDPRTRVLLEIAGDLVNKPAH